MAKKSLTFFLCGYILTSENKNKRTKGEAAMMYGEFITGTGCKDNEHNYKVFKNLEIMYMNSDMSKEEIYEYGKKLVDNSKSAEQLEFERKLKAEIEDLKKELAKQKEIVNTYAEYVKGDPTDDFWKAQLRWAKEEARRIRRKISELRWIMA
jgi:hypothetical protein